MSASSNGTSATPNGTFVRGYQVKNLHILRAALHLDEDTYRMALAQFRRDGSPVTTSKDLTFQQAESLINMWYEQAKSIGLKPMLFRRDPNQYATPEAVTKLHYHAIRCGIKYAPLGAYDVGDGHVLAGEELKTWLLARWRAKSRLPQNVLRDMFSSWINRKANEFLIDGGFRQYRHGFRFEVLFFTQLHEDECKHLINRFRAIHEQLDIVQQQTGDPS